MFVCPFCQIPLIESTRILRVEDQEAVEQHPDWLKYICPTQNCRGFFFDSNGKIYRLYKQTRLETLIILALENDI